MWGVDRGQIFEVAIQILQVCLLEKKVMISNQSTTG